MKKILSIILCSVLVASVFAIVPFTVSAAKSGTTGDCTWRLNDEGTLIFSGNGAMEDDYSWSQCESDVNCIVIEDGVTSICSSAFNGWANLTSVTIGNSVTSIGESAFSDCLSLTSINIPDSVTSIGRYALDYTGWYIYQPEGLIYAGKVVYAYKGTMPSDTSIVLKDGTKGIAECAFSDCTGLTSIKIPDSVTNIGYSAFSDCTGLTSIEIPDSVMTIGNIAFYGCTGLASIEIPDSVMTIGSNAFYGTAWYNNHPDGIVYAGKIACDYKGDMPSDGSIVIQAGTIAIAMDMFLYDKSIKSIEIPGSVKIIGSQAFYDCTMLTSVTLGNGVESIGGGAFLGCKNLKSIDIPDSVKSISGFAFCFCDKMASISIGNGLTSIDEGVFEGCTNLTSVTIPDSVMTIGNIAFCGCTRLTNVEIPDSVTSISDEAFLDCTLLKSVTIPYNVTNIGSMAFGYYTDHTNHTYKKISGFKIYGFTGSEAEKYASDNGFTFVEIGVAPTEPTTEPTTEPKPVAVLGDANGDNSVDVLDATIVQKHAVGKADLSDDQIAVTDVNDDGIADILDAAEIQKFAAGKITEFKKKA